MLSLLYRNGHVSVNRIVLKILVMVSRNVFKRNVREYRRLSNVSLKCYNGVPMRLVFVLLNTGVRAVLLVIN